MQLYKILIVTDTWSGTIILTVAVLKTQYAKYTQRWYKNLKVTEHICSLLECSSLELGTMVYFTGPLRVRF